MHSLVSQILAVTPIRALIYASAFTDFTVTGELDFYGYRIQLSPEQRLHFLSIWNICMKFQMRFRLRFCRMVCCLITSISQDRHCFLQMSFLICVLGEIHRITISVFRTKLVWIEFFGLLRYRLGVWILYCTGCISYSCNPFCRNFAIRCFRWCAQLREVKWAVAK